MMFTVLQRLVESLVDQMLEAKLREAPNRLLRRPVEPDPERQNTCETMKRRSQELGIDELGALGRLHMWQQRGPVADLRDERSVDQVAQRSVEVVAHKRNGLPFRVARNGY